MFKSSYADLLDKLILQLSITRLQLDNVDNETKTSQPFLGHISDSLDHFVEQANDDAFQLEHSERKQLGLHLKLLLGSLEKLFSGETPEGSIEDQFLTAFSDVDVFPEEVVRNIMETCEISPRHFEEFTRSLNASSGLLISRKGLYATIRKFPVQSRNDLRDFENKIPKFQTSLSKILPLYRQISLGASLGSVFTSSSLNAEKISEQYRHLESTSESLNYLSTIYSELNEVGLADSFQKRSRGRIEEKPVKLWAEEFLSVISKLRNIPLSELPLSRDANITVGLRLALAHLHYPVNGEKAYDLANDIRAKHKK